jgi:hypothetical protein
MYSKRSTQTKSDLNSKTVLQRLHIPNSLHFLDSHCATAEEAMAVQLLSRSDAPWNHDEHSEIRLIFKIYSEFISGAMSRYPIQSFTPNPSSKRISITNA